MGQFYNGNVGSGFAFLGTNILFNSLWILADNPGMFYVGLFGAIVVNVWSIVDAVSGAKKKNIERGYRVWGSTYLQVIPLYYRHPLA